MESFKRKSDNGSKQYIDAQTKRGNEGGKSPADSISGNIEPLSDFDICHLGFINQFSFINIKFTTFLNLRLT